MSWELYTAFTLATVLLILIPGPNVLLIVATSLSDGTRPALVTVAGTQTAQFLQLCVTAAGMTSLLLLLSDWFEVLRWLGVAYLVYLGIQQWRAGLIDPKAVDDQTSGRRHFWRGFLVAVTNPKTLFFYAAFFPQFVDPTAPLTAQLVLLCTTYLVIATLLDGGYALLAGRLRGRLMSRRGQRIRNRVTGSLLIGAGLGLALARRGN